VLFLLNLLASLLHLLQLLLQPTLLLFAALLQLEFGLRKSRFLFDQSLDDDDLMLFDFAVSDLVVELVCL